MPVVFRSHYLERGTAATTPRPEQVGAAIAVSAAPGERQPATVSVRAGAEELKGVGIELAADLRSDAGDAIPRSAVEIRLVEPLAAWKGRAYTSPLDEAESEARKHHEWALPRFQGTLDIPARTTRRFWLTIRVPEDARAGTYRSRIVVGQTVTKLGPDLGRFLALQTLDYEVNVLPIRLATAAETGMAFFMYHNTAYFPKELVNVDYQRRVFEDMREHGMTTATLYLYPQVDAGKVDLATPQAEHLSFTQAMDLLAETKLVAPGRPVIWLGAENYQDGEVWTAVLQERIRRNWPEIIFYAVDEPEEEDRNVHVRAFMKAFHAYRRRHPDLPVRVTTAIGSSRGVQTVGHYYDLWIGCMAQETGESGLIADARMRKKELWTYDCMLAPVDAETDRYYFGIWAWVSGVKGCSHWCYYDGGPRLSYVYPDPAQIIPTIGWEAVREGIADYRHLFTLKRLADQLRAAGKADSAKNADRILEQVKAMVTMDRYGQAYHEVRKGEAVATAYERPRVEPGLALEAYDRLRLEVAREIENLAGILAKPN